MARAFFTAAQSATARRPRRTSGRFGASRTDAVALADVNGDGTLDIVAGSNLNVDEGTQSAVYLNNGAGVFATAKSSDCALPENAKVLRCFGANDPSALIGRIAAGDVDGDPRASTDIVIAYRGKNAVYRNSGEGVFSTENSFDALAAPVGSLALDEEAALSAANNPAVTARAERSLTLADVNVDGAADIVAGTSLQGAYAYLNDLGRPFLPGSAPFRSAQATRLLSCRGGRRCRQRWRSRPGGRQRQPAQRDLSEQRRRQLPARRHFREQQGAGRGRGRGRFERRRPAGCHLRRKQYRPQDST